MMQVIPNSSRTPHLGVEPALDRARQTRQVVDLPSDPNSLVVSDMVMEEDFYNQLKSISSTIISIQYNKNEFLTFKVYQASQGQVVWSDVEGVGLQCQIDGKTYILNREHLNQMSRRERHDLLNHLEVDDNRLFQD